MEFIFLGAVILFLFIVSLLARPEKSGARHEQDFSVDYHYQHGRHQVRYPDGRLSQPFLPYTARAYAEMFHGEVIPRQN